MYNTNKNTRVITWSEVKKHTTDEDAWVVHNNKVYDVSSWYEHPGGGVIFTHAGDDMTDIFAAFHAAGSHAAMNRFYIGELDKSTRIYSDPKQEAFEKGYRRLRTQLISMGMFKSSKAYYLYKCTFNMCMWAAAVAMVRTKRCTSPALHL